MTTCDFLTFSEADCAKLQTKTPITCFVFFLLKKQSLNLKLPLFKLYLKWDSTIRL